jgi:hypothetical protein
VGGPPHHRHPAQVEEWLDRLETGGAVVVPPHHQHRAHLGQVEQCLVDDLLVFGGGGRDVEEVADDERDIDLLLPGNGDDLGEHRPVLPGPGATADLPPHMPVRRVEQSLGGATLVISAIVGPGSDRFGER